MNFAISNSKISFGRRIFKDLCKVFIGIQPVILLKSIIQ